MGASWQSSGLASDLRETVSLHHATYESAEHAGLIALVELSDLLCRMSGLNHGYIEHREVNLLEQNGFVVLSKRYPELECFDWARLTFELESYMDEEHALVHAILPPMSLNLDDTPRIRVLIVDDSAFMRTALSRMVACEPDMEVVATVSCGSVAFEKVSSLDPDVVTLDVAMPGLDGLGTLRCIMSQSPRPVIMVSATTERDAETTLEALSAGAFDYLPKQLSPTSLEIAHIRTELISKIRAAAQSRRSRLVVSETKKPPHSAHLDSPRRTFATPAVIAIGVSTGGPKALEQILPRFPADYPIPILIVQHMPIGFTTALAQRLSSISSIKVKEAAHEELVRPAVCIAPAGLHMRVIPRVSDSSQCFTSTSNLRTRCTFLQSTS